VKNDVIQVDYTEWLRFQPFLINGPCCNLAFPQGECWAILSEYSIDSMAAMVWYTFAFRHSPYRKAAIPELKGLSRPDEIAFLNKNVRLLARISTLPPFRRQGYAGRLLAATLNRPDVAYIECLTAWPDIRRLLLAAGFVRAGDCYGGAIDYWLWRRAAKGD
jgi:GNAT superfamily N-acetyltransferase